MPLPLRLATGCPRAYPRVLFGTAGAANRGARLRRVTPAAESVLAVRSVGATPSAIRFSQGPGEDSVRDREIAIVHDDVGGELDDVRVVQLVVLHGGPRVRRRPVEVRSRHRNRTQVRL